MNRTLPLLLALLMTLAGCAEDPDAVGLGDVAHDDPGGDDATGSGTDAGGNATQGADATGAADPVVLTVDATVLVVQDGNATLTGSTDRPATVTVAHANGSDSFDADGAWDFTYLPPFGHTEAVVTADDGATTANATVLMQRNKLVTIEVDYDAASGRTDTSHTLWWDYGGLRSLHEDESYQGCEQPHPERPNAHDALLDYEDFSGVDIGFTECGQFGVSVETIDGYASASGFWCWQVNGENAEFGISLLELEHGDVFTFLDCYVAFPGA